MKNKEHPDDLIIAQEERDNERKRFLHSLDEELFMIHKEIVKEIKKEEKK